MGGASREATPQEKCSRRELTLRFKLILNRFISATVMGSVLTGCGTGTLNTLGSPIEPFARPTVDSRIMVARNAPPPELVPPPLSLKPMARGKPDIFISDVYDGLVNGYDLRTGQLTEQLTGFSLPQTLATDRAGNLYVAATGDSAIYVFPPGATTPSLTLNDDGWYPTGVAVSSKGEVAVSNKFSISYQQGSVAFYKPGQSTAFNLISSSTFSVPVFCVYDAHGNLYVDGGGAYDGSVAEILHGGEGKSFKLLGIDGLGLIGGIQVAKNGDILVLDQAWDTIYRYWPGHHQAAGSTFLQTNGDPVTFALVPPRQNVLYDADFALNQSDAYPYPSGGPPGRSLSTSYAVGVAISTGGAQ